MKREEYRKAFDQIPFSAGFQERTANLLRQRARELEKENRSMNFRQKSWRFRWRPPWRFWLYPCLPPWCG